MSDFAALPNGDPPGLDAVVAAVVAGFPASARPEATALLRDHILPWTLRDLSEVPMPRRLTEVVYQDLSERLGRMPAAGRLAELAVIACETAADRLVGEATSLAVARYLLDHPKASGGDPWRGDAARWQGLSVAQLAGESARRAVELEQLTKTAPPACSRALGQKAIHTRLALGSAQTGAFGTAAGMLFDFLREVGEQPQELDVH